MPIGINGHRYYTFGPSPRKIVLDLQPVLKGSKWYLYCKEYGYYDTTFTTRDTKSVSASDSYIYDGESTIYFVLNSDTSIIFKKTSLDCWRKD